MPAGKLPFTATAAQSKRTDMGDGAFAVLVRFKTQTGGALFSKAPATGEWVPDAKTLYIKRGRLIYDIGWLGNLETRPRVDDGEWHHALLNVVDGRAQIHADGELLGTRRLTRPDKAEHRFRIGVAGDDEEFQPFTEGAIAFTRFTINRSPQRKLMMPVPARRSRASRCMSGIQPRKSRRSNLRPPKPRRPGGISRRSCNRPFAGRRPRRK